MHEICSNFCFGENQQFFAYAKFFNKMSEFQYFLNQTPGRSKQKLKADSWRLSWLSTGGIFGAFTNESDQQMSARFTSPLKKKTTLSSENQEWFMNLGIRNPDLPRVKSQDYIMPKTNVELDDHIDQT